MKSSEELVDIVTPDGQLVRTISKHAAHKDGLLHHVVIGVVRDAEGNRVLVRQNAHKQDAGQYVNPVGGHVSAGESIEDALRREVREEIGWANVTINPIGAAIFRRTILARDEHHFFNVFLIESADAFVLNEESTEVRHMPAAEYNRLLRERPELFGDAHHFVERSFPDFFAA